VPDPWLARCLGWLASRWTDRVVAVSDALRQHLAEQVVANPDRLVLIPNGVDTAVFRPQPASGRIAVELGFEPGSPVVGSIGRLEHIKGYDVLIEAFALLLQGWDQGPLPLLVVAGEGSERPRLETLVRRRGLGARVRLLGWRDDVHDLHAAFTLFAMGSRSEGTSVSLLEAMSAGLCPVVTAVGGNRAVLGPELAHRLVPGEDPVRLAEALRQALSDPQRLAADGQAARRRVEERFSLDAMVQAYEGVYLEGWARAGVAPNVPRTPIRR
jgi:glycosyltransferase involved in cell wall biosynthesis